MRITTHYLCFFVNSAYATSVTCQRRDWPGRDPVVAGLQICDLKSLLGNSATMVKTVSSNIHQRRMCIDFEELPSVFKDAITIARLIGCQWIWIDSLCIVQDDEKDWKAEASRMRDVYANSYINFAATSCSSSSISLCRNRFSTIPCANQDEQWPTSFAVGDSVFARLTNPVDHDFIAGSHSSLYNDKENRLKAHARLVYQERLLALRTIHFCRSEMIWECKTTV